MKKSFLKKFIKILSTIILATFLFSACNNDTDFDREIPTEEQSDETN